MRKTCLKAIYELARADPKVFFLGSDLGSGTMEEFKVNLPERFLMEGISEANLIGIAAGLALNGKVPFVNTIASFLTRRCYEQIVIDLCLHNLNVRLIGNGGGLVYAPLGPTHVATEDIAIMRAIPNMTVVAPCDADEMKRLIAATADHVGPIYIRLARGGDKIVSSSRDPFRIGRAIAVRDGDDALIVATGVALQCALEAAEQLQARGAAVGVVHAHTVKPLDRTLILEKAEKTSLIIVVEEHSTIGGLGSAVAEIVAEAGFSSPKLFRRVGLPDVFPDGYGSQTSLMERYAIAPKHLVAYIADHLDSLPLPAKRADLAD